MSAPAQKVSPAPVRTSTRTAGSAASDSSSPGSASHMSAVIALRLAGLLMTTVATPSATPCSSRGPAAAAHGACSLSPMRRMLSPGAEPTIGKGPRRTGPRGVADDRTHDRARTDPLLPGLLATGIGGRRIVSLMTDQRSPQQDKK
ncbi:hypothetical protein GA0115239_11736 [Streptomyces sp. BpilaLS-43]|nr:hypothetical protein GA0115239_11736 [Streptomyces sp. BpilaLS-43]